MRFVGRDRPRRLGQLIRYLNMFTAHANRFAVLKSHERDLCRIRWIETKCSDVSWIDVNGRTRNAGVLAFQTGLLHVAQFGDACSARAAKLFPHSAVQCPEVVNPSVTR